MQDGSPVPSAFSIDGSEFVVAQGSVLETSAPYELSLISTEINTGLVNSEV